MSFGNPISHNNSQGTLMKVSRDHKMTVRSTEPHKGHFFSFNFWRNPQAFHLKFTTKFSKSFLLVHCSPCRNFMISTCSSRVFWFIELGIPFVSAQQNDKGPRLTPTNTPWDGKPGRWQRPGLRKTGRLGDFAPVEVAVRARRWRSSPNQKSQKLFHPNTTPHPSHLKWKPLFRKSQSMPCSLHRFFGRPWHPALWRSRSFIFLPAVKSQIFTWPGSRCVKTY